MTTATTGTTPSWLARCLPPPPMPPELPRSELLPCKNLLRHVEERTHDDLHSQLLHHARRATALKRALVKEVQTMERLYYRNNNQHRQAIHWKKLHECRRLLKRLVGELDKTEVRENRDITDILVGLERCFKRVGEKGKAETWEVIPNRAAVAYAANRIAGASVLVDQTLSVVQNSYGAFRQVLSQTYFMALSLLFLSNLSRIHAILRVWADDIAECFLLLRQWVECFPNDCEESSEFANLCLTDLPKTLKVLREQLTEFKQGLRQSKSADDDLSVSDALKASHETSLQEVFGESMNQENGADIETSETVNAVEDFGEIIVRNNPSSDAISSPLVVDAPLREESEAPIELDELETSPVIDICRSLPDVEENGTKTSTKIPGIKKKAKRAASDNPTLEGIKKKVKKKKKQKNEKDDIDDIFNLF